jgi:hypothetical protein
MNLSFILDKLPWRLQSYLGYRPIKSITAREYFGNQYSSPNLQSEFITKVLPGGKINLKPAISLNDFEHKHFTEITEKPYDECLFFSLNNAKFVQHNLLPTVIDCKNRMISDANKDPKKGRKLHPIFTVAKLNKPKKLDGKVLLLSTDGGHNGYFHWMCRILPKLWVLEQFNISINQFDYILVNAGDFKFKHVSFEEFNIPKEKIIYTENEEVFHCNQLFIINNIRYHIEGIEFLKNRFLNDSNSSIETFDKIYISRKKALHRKIINEDKLISFLNDKGFKTINLEDYSLQEQAFLINNCKFLISIHGAGLSNLIFGTKDLTIVEIIEDTFVNVNYWFYSNIIGIKYYYYIGKAIQTEYSKTKNRFGYDDIELNDDFYSKLDTLI